MADAARLVQGPCFHLATTKMDLDITNCNPPQGWAKLLFSTRFNGRYLLLALVSALPVLSGCNGCNSGSTTGPGAATSADELLRRMVTAYQEAKTYEDRAKVRVSYKQK